MQRAAALLALAGAARGQCGPPDTCYKCTAGSGTGCVQSDNGVTLAQCQQLCQAPTPPAPAPPASQKYTCAQSGCVAAAAGVTLAQCQQLCQAPTPPAPTPPAPAPPGSLYKCNSQGQCAASGSGVDLPTCQALCRAPAPAPPAPAGQMYKCINGQCQAAATGFSLADCEAFPCGAPPLPPAPGALYRCQGNTCVSSATGTDFDSCQQICRAPQPVPPAPKKVCFGGTCLKCLEEYTLEILESVEACLGILDHPMHEIKQIKKCIAVSTYDIENLTLMGEKCLLGKNKNSDLTESAAWLRLKKLSQVNTRARDAIQRLESSV